MAPRRRLLLLVLSLLLPATLLPGASASAQQPSSGSSDPGMQEWVRVPRDQVAAQCGMDPALLERAQVQLSPRPFVIVRHGKLCWESTGTEETYHVASITKTMGGLLFGMAAARSSLSDEDPVTRWVDPDQLGLVNPEAKFAHVLAMISTKPDLTYGRRGPWSYDILGNREIYQVINGVNRVIAEEPEAFPGVENIAEFAQQELFEPLGMRSSDWAGETIGFSLNSTVRDMARMGLLLLQRGEYGGERLIDAEYMFRMTHPSFEDSNTGFGYLTYNNADLNWFYSTGTNDLACSPVASWPHYPHRPFYEATDPNGGAPTRAQTYDVGLNWAAGAGGQRIVVHRGLDLVMTIRDESTNEGHKSVWNAIRPALVAEDPVFDGDEVAFCEAYRSGEYAPDLLPDLTVAPATLSFTDGGQTVFSAVVSNPGEQHATGVPVRFSVDGVPVGPDQAVDQVPLGDSVTVNSTAWTAPTDGRTHTVTVQVDPDDAVAEAETDPNAASFSFSLPSGSPGASVERYGGGDRIATAAAVSGAGVERAETVVIARADDPADALAGAPLAAHLDAPLLLSAGDGLSEATAAEIRRLGATEAVLLGGPSALGEQVVRDLVEVEVAVGEVRRVAGENRHATAAAIAAELPAGGAVFVVRGDAAGFADAVAVSGLAASQRRPILLTEAGRLPAESAEALDEVETAVVIGGEAAVSEAVATEIGRHATAVRRLSGPTRYGTSAAVAEDALERGLDAQVAWIATGVDFPDALVAGAAAARDQALLLLVDGRDLDGSRATRDLLAASSVRTFRLAGGPAAISALAHRQLDALVR